MRVALFLAMALAANEPARSRDESWSLPTATWTINAPHLDDWLPLIPNAMDLLVVDVSLNGKATKALIDTGTAWILVSDSLFADARPSITLGTTTGRLPGAPVIIRELTIGPTTIRNERVMATDLSAPKQGLDSGIDVVLGAPVFERISLEVDRDRNRVRFVNVSKPPAGASSQPVQYDQASGSLNVAVSICGHADLSAILDTGFPQSLITNTDADTGPPCGREIGSQLMRDGGAISRYKRVSIESLRILGHETRNTVILQGFGARQNTSSVGLAGIPFRHFIIDVSDHVIYGLPS